MVLFLVFYLTYRILCGIRRTRCGLYIYSLWWLAEFIKVIKLEFNATFVTGVAGMNTLMCYAPCGGYMVCNCFV